MYDISYNMNICILYIYTIYMAYIGQYKDL